MSGSSICNIISPSQVIILITGNIKQFKMMMVAIVNALVRCTMPKYCVCDSCIAAGPIIECIKNAILTIDILDAIKPIKCSQCQEQFSDKLQLNKHEAAVHVKERFRNLSKIIPGKLSLTMLK